MDLEKISEYRLGETEEFLTCIGTEEAHAVVLNLLTQTERTLDILSHEFDPDIYDQVDCYEAFESLALNGGHTKIRILLQEPQLIVRRGHSVVEMAKRLPSRFELRRPHKTHRFLPDGLLIVDNLGYMHRPYPDAMKFFANFKDPLRVRELKELFDEIWNEAGYDPNLRNLMI